MKTKQLYLVPYAHIDWQWRNNRHYFVHRNRQVIFAALDFLLAEPRYKWCGFHKFHVIEDFWNTYPQFHDALKKLVRERRIDLAGSTYVTPMAPHIEDEVLIRTIVEGKRCFGELFGEVEDRLLYFADISIPYEQIPQIARKAGFDFYLVDRPFAVFEFKGIPREFVWKGIDGSELIVNHTSYAMNFPGAGGNHTVASPGVFEPLATELEKRIAFLEQLARREYLYIPDACDWAFPTINLPEFVDYWNETHPDCPAKIATHSEYFQRLELDRDELPVLTGNRDIVGWNGIYGINGEHGNRRLRAVANALVSAEKLCAFAHLVHDYEIPFREHRSMWHELLIGYAHGGYHNSTLMPEDYAAMEAKLDELSMRIENTAQGAAVCLLDSGDEDFLFNPLEFDRREWVNVNGQWRRTKVPALGMAKISDTVQNYGAGSIQEDSISGNGQSDVFSWEGFRKGCRLSLAVQRGEVALLTANFTSREELNPTVKRAEASPVPGGDVRSLHFVCEQTEAKVTMSCFPEEPFIRVRTYLKTSLENARFLLQVSTPWEKSAIIADEPFLVRQRDPLGEPQVDLMRSRPVGMFESPEESSSDVSEGENRGVFYGHTFAAAEGPEGGIALVNRGTPGYQFTGCELGNILLSVRTPESLDQYRRCSHLLPPHEYVFEHLLFFYAPQDRNMVYRLARAFNFPLLHLKGKQAPAARLVSGLPSNIFLSAAYWDEGVVLRFFEMEGKVTECELTLPCPRELVLEECNLLLRPMPGSRAVAVQQGQVQLAFSPYEIKTVRLRYWKNGKRNA